MEHLGCDRRLVLARPSTLPGTPAAPGRRAARRHTSMHSFNDWLRSGFWQNGRGVRSLSLSPDDRRWRTSASRLSLEDPAGPGGDASRPIPAGLTKTPTRCRFTLWTSAKTHLRWLIQLQHRRTSRPRRSPGLRHRPARLSGQRSHRSRAGPPRSGLRRGPRNVGTRPHLPVPRRPADRGRQRHHATTRPTKPVNQQADPDVS